MRKWKTKAAAGLFCLALAGGSGAEHLVAHAEPKAADLYVVQGVDNYLALRDEPEYNADNEIGKLNNGDLFYSMTGLIDDYAYGYTRAGDMGYVNSDYLVSPEEADYYIGAGLEYSYEEDERILETDYFSIHLPAEYEWTHEMISSTIMKVIYTPAEEAGYGGTVMTIRAFDPGDTSYVDAPSWFLAGGNREKIYVVLMPTDVQFDPDDEVQRLEYGTLLEKAKEISIKK